MNMIILYSYTLNIEHTLNTWLLANNNTLSYATPQSVEILFTAFHLWFHDALFFESSSGGLW